MEYVLFSAWILSPHKMFLRFIHVIAWIKSSFLFIAKEDSVVWIYHILFIHSSAHGHLSCFHLLPFVSNTAVNIVVQLFV